MGFWMAAAPALISAGSSILGGLMNKNKNAVPPEVLKKLGLEADILGMKKGYLDQLDNGLGRGALLDPATGKVLRMRLPGVGGDQKGFDSSMDAFLNNADFSLARDQDLLKALISLSTTGDSGSSATAGQAQEYAAGQKAAGSTAKLIDELGNAAFDSWMEKKAGKTAPAIPQTLEKIPYNFDFDAILKGVG